MSIRDINLCCRCVQDEAHGTAAALVGRDAEVADLWARLEEASTAPRGTAAAEVGTVAHPATSLEASGLAPVVGMLLLKSARTGNVEAPHIFALDPSFHLSSF